MPRGLTGAFPSPRHKLLFARPYRITVAPPEFSWVPKQLDTWGNNQFGDCVSAEEAFAKATYSPEIFIPEQTVIDWARKHGFLNGADLTSVMEAMQKDGFQVGGQQYDDGAYAAVDYSQEPILRSAISNGPVKIAIASGALPSGAGNHMGWYSFGNQHDRNTDHCVALSGYGTAQYCFSALGVALPSGVDPNKPDCYHLYTWKTIGVVDHGWIMGTCDEAWLRNPTTVGVPPLPEPTPAPVVIDWGDV